MELQFDGNKFRLNLEAMTKCNIGYYEHNTVDMQPITLSEVFGNN